MRTTQYYGLNARGHKLVTACTEVQDSVRRTFPDGKVEKFVKTSTIDLVKREDLPETIGMFDEDNLTKFTMPDGKAYHEFVQEESWSSGPMIFTALKTEDGEVVKESLWSSQEINETCGEQIMYTIGVFVFVVGNREIESSDDAEDLKPLKEAYPDGEIVHRQEWESRSMQEAVPERYNPEEEM